MSATLIFVNGFAYAGKSHWAAQSLLSQSSVLFWGTAQPHSEQDDLIESIQEQQKHRPAHWLTLEGLVPLELLLERCRTHHCQSMIIDSVPLWLGAQITAVYQRYDQQQIRLHLHKEIQFFLHTLSAIKQVLSEKLIIVSGEAGGGVVPEFAAGRLYREQLGKFNQILAAQAEQVYWLQSGLATVLK